MRRAEQRFPTEGKGRGHPSHGQERSPERASGHARLCARGGTAEAASAPDAVDAVVVAGVRSGLEVVAVVPDGLREKGLDLRREVRGGGRATAGEAATEPRNVLAQLGASEMLREQVGRVLGPKNFAKRDVALPHAFLDPELADR